MYVLSFLFIVFNVQAILYHQRTGCVLQPAAVLKITFIILLQYISWYVLSFILIVFNVQAILYLLRTGCVSPLVHTISSLIRWEGK